LRRWATSRKVGCSNPDKVIHFLSNLPNPSSCTIALGLPGL
jgi:hypothetical protein